MASSARGLRLFKSLELLKFKPNFDLSNVINKVKLQSACNGVLKGTFTIEPMMCNLGNTLHGGYVAGVIDVFSFYSQLSNPDGRVSWTISMNVTYLASANLGEIVNVETKPLLNGKLSIVETYITNEKGKLLAKGVASFIAGSEKHQHALKDICNFNVYEQ